ncbi:MAG: glycoside hydrolase family 2 TIM barrel-domain containing protein, partial [Pseudomonadota bacterium]
MNVTNNRSNSLISNPFARQHISLNGMWRSIVDQLDIGYYDFLGRPTKRGFFRDYKPRSERDLVEYNFDASPQISVPGDWNTQDPTLLRYEGTVWYKKEFVCEPAPGRRYFLYFGGANYRTNAYLNGQPVGEHTGGFTPFNFEVTDRLLPGKNFVVVQVNNTRLPEAVPTMNYDWWNYGGITRDVILLDVPDTFIQDYFLQLKPGTNNRLAGWIRLDGAQQQQHVEIDIGELGVNHKVSTDDNGYAAFEIEVAPTLWSPDNPKLYDVDIIAQSDHVAERVGFRTIEVDGPDILLNGQPIFLRGISLHEESPMGPGRATSREDALVSLEWAKSLNANFVRLAHYPHNEHTVRLADEMGLLVWAEIPVYWRIHWDNAETYANAENQLTELIERDKNRASTIIWSMANETPYIPERLEFISRLASHARQLDPTRLISAALFPFEPSQWGSSLPNPLVINDPLGEVLDVLATNEYFGWYYEPPQPLPETKIETELNKPLIISEFGAGARQGYHGGENTRWTEEFQVRFY